MNETCEWKFSSDFAVYLTPHGSQDYLLEDCADCGKPVALKAGPGEPQLASEILGGPRACTPKEAGPVDCRREVPVWLNKKLVLYPGPDA